MLTYLPHGVLPDLDALRNGADHNEDGHGFAIVAGRRLIIRHGLDPKKVIADFDRLRRAHPDGPALFHSRFGTAGSMTELNCHPFRVGGDRRTVVAHNGILPSIVQPERGDRRCDTRIFAQDLLRGWNLDDPDNRAEIERWMGGGNKIVILSVNPAYDHSYILNEHAGIWEADGIWYSNRDYQDRGAWRYVVASPPARDWAWDRDDVAASTNRTSFGVCPACRSADVAGS